MRSKLAQGPGRGSFLVNPTAPLSFANYFGKTLHRFFEGARLVSH
jgi:hypothetical protein